MARFNNYYEEQFGDRVRDVAKKPSSNGERSPTPGNGTGNGNGSGAGWAGFLVLFVVIALLRGVSSNSSRYPTYTPPPRIELPDLKGVEDAQRRLDEMRRLDELRRHQELMRGFDQKLRDPARLPGQPAPQQKPLPNE